MQNPEKFLQNCLPNSDLAENRFSQNYGRDPKIENFDPDCQILVNFWSGRGFLALEAEIFGHEVGFCHFCHFGSWSLSRPRPLRDQIEVSLKSLPMAEGA